MAGKHRKRRAHRTRRTAARVTTKVAALGVATATATALAGPAALPEDREVARDTDVALAAAVNPFPAPDDIPDLTGGLGGAGYDFSQTIADVLVRAIVENLNLAALAGAAGLSPEAVLDTLLGGVLGEIPASLLDDVVGAIPIDVSAVTDALLAPLPEAVRGLVSGLVSAGLPDTLGGLLGLLGIDLSDALNLSDLAGPVNIITAGPPFTLLKLLGVDLGWVPGLPNSVAAAINNSDYLDLEVGLGDVLGALPAGQLILSILATAGVSIPTVDVLEVRVPVVVGFGLGAFAAATGYEKVVADLVHQPGGPQATEHPLLGSVTVLPMVLLFNPARPNGGPLARMYPLLGLFGINAVNPDTEITSRGGIPLLNTGLSLGGANLIPVLIDGGVQYHPSSDIAAWPNPVSLANNLMAGLLPTYILRGLTLDTVPEQLTTQLAEILSGVGSGPLHLNLYLTLPSSTLPLLEPLYLASDVLNLATFGALPVNPFNLVANAFAPVLTSMANLGYTDVVYNPQTGAYERTLTEAGIPTPFFSFPNVDWAQVPAVLFNQLVAGISKEFLSGNPTPGTPNALTGLLDLLGGLGGLLDGLNLSDQLADIVGELAPTGADDATAGARMFVSGGDEISSGKEGFERERDTEQKRDSSLGETPPASAGDDGTDAEAGDKIEDDAKDDAKIDAKDDVKIDPEDDPESEPAPTGKHAKPDSDTTVSSIIGSITPGSAPKHAKPDEGEKPAAATSSDNESGSAAA